MLLFVNTEKIAANVSIYVTCGPYPSLHIAFLLQMKLAKKANCGMSFSLLTSIT